MPARTGGGGGSSPPLTPEEEAALAAANTAPAPAPSNYVPGSTYVPPPPAPVPSELYGGASGVEPTGYNDPNYVVTYHPASGEEPTANSTDYLWTSNGRTPPPNYDRPFPAARLASPTGEVFNPSPSPDRYLPGPPRNFVPGSTYIPTVPLPDPRIPLDERIPPPPIAIGRVPGSAAYRRGPATDDPYVSPGLGGYAESPLSREGRPPASRNPQRYIPADAREPQDYQPGSTYVPNYIGMPRLGDEKLQWHPIVPSEMYGRGLAEHERQPSRTRVDTIYPASGDPETARFTDYLRGGTVMMQGGDASPRVYRDGRLVNPDAVPQDRGGFLAYLETARQARQRRNRTLRGLFGSGE